MSFLDVAVRWYLMGLAATAAFLPWVVLFLRPLADRGASLARPLALLGLIYPLWLLASISPIPFNNLGLWLTLIGAAAVGWVLVLRRRSIDSVVLRHVALAEAAFLLSFALFVWFHGYGPALTDQEKPSDLMMLSSTMRATEMPPRDAWLAGERINYYYLGYVTFAALGRLVGAAPEVVFNLALATVFGMTVVAVLGVAANAVARWRPGLVAIAGGALAGMLVIILGNTWAMVRFLQEPASAFDSSGPGLLFFESIGWGATRFLHDTDDVYAITEFPAFSFILADLHPHLMALPYTVVALGIAWLLAVLPGRGWRSADVVGRVVVSGGLLGALYAMNSWDFPTYLAVAALALLLGPNGRTMHERVRLLGLLASGAVLLWAPFFLRFEAPTAPSSSGAAETVGELPVIGGVLASLAGYTGERTSAREYLGIFGFFYIVAVALIGIALWRCRGRPTDPVTTRAALVGGVILLLGALLIPAPLLMLCGLPLIAIVLLIDRDARFSLANIALGLFALAFALTLIPEFVYVLDIFGQRMNTIFKLYYQVWLLMAFGSALAIVALWSAPRRLPFARIAPSVLTAVILAGGLVYPVVAGYQWLEWRSPDREWQGLDGLAYFEKSHPDERAALAWLWEHGSSEDVLLAAGGCEWDINVGRTAAATGIPTVLGWYWHEIQWRLGQPGYRQEIDQRIQDINALYASRPQELIDRYGVTLIFVGQSERGEDGSSVPAPDCATGPFEGINDPDFPGPGWELAFQQGEVRIYQRVG